MSYQKKESGKKKFAIFTTYLMMTFISGCAQLTVLDKDNNYCVPCSELIKPKASTDDANETKRDVLIIRTTIMEYCEKTKQGDL